MRMPVFCLDPPKPSEIRRILWQGAAALVSYLVKPDGGHPANARYTSARIPAMRWINSFRGRVGTYGEDLGSLELSPSLPSN